MRLRLRGTVLASHPGYGMGVAFELDTEEERTNLKKVDRLRRHHDGTDRIKPFRQRFVGTANPSKNVRFKCIQDSIKCQELVPPKGWIQLRRPSLSLSFFACDKAADHTYRLARSRCLWSISCSRILICDPSLRSSPSQGFAVKPSAAAYVIDTPPCEMPML